MGFDAVIEELDISIDSILSEIRKDDVYTLPAFPEYIASKLGELRALNNIKGLITIRGK